MTTDIVMPNLGFDTQAGKLVEWLKQPGDHVARGEAIAVIESDKANVELESIAEGLLLEQFYTEGMDISVGAVIARIGREGDQAVDTAKAVDTANVVSAVATTGSVASPAAAVRVEASPIARRLAVEHNLDLATIQGSGPKGRIKRADVEGYISGQPTAPAEAGGRALLALPKVRKAAREAGINLASVPATGSRGEITLADLAILQTLAVPPLPDPAAASDLAMPVGVQEVALSRTRQVIGRRLGASKRDAPHFYVTGEFDLETALLRLRTFPAPQPRVNDLIQFLTAQTLRQVPALNATFADDLLLYYDTVNLAIAVAREDGLITPVIHKADRYSLTGLAAESREIIERTRINRLLADDLSDATFTISNLGIIRQVDHFTAVINPPQVAILAVGTVKQRPIVLDNGLFIRHTVHLTLSGDHRVVDGMHLGQFMATFQEKLDRFNQGQEI